MLRNLSIHSNSNRHFQVDPNANNCYPPPPPPPIISHSRTHSGPVIGVQYTPVECGGGTAAPGGAADAETALHHPGDNMELLGGTQYSSLVSNANPAVAPSAAGSSEYMAMSPPNATPTTTRWVFNLLDGGTKLKIEVKPSVICMRLYGLSTLQ